ncbi:MAG: hypothetical protein ACXU8A_06295 [Burkholderiaceae bacterium]
MKPGVVKGIEELKEQFKESIFTIREDENGGAYVCIESVQLGERYQPASTWMGFHMTAQYPYADIYPVFVGEEIGRVDGRAFEAPVTRGHTFESRPAIQISRRCTTADNGSQKATAKILKILNFMGNLP